MTPAPSASKKKWAGILTRRERWGLSVRGWLLLLALLPALACIIGLTVYPFLAITERVDTRLLVVEGWIRDYAIEVAVEEFKAGDYEQVYATGGPVNGLSAYINDYSTSASIGAGRLKAAGIAADRVHMAPSRVIAQDRTYHSALALKKRLQDHGRTVTGINIVTEGAHARRTRLIFEKAFGEGVDVGVISVHSPGFDQKRWWRYSEGVREVLSESIAYLYARLLFRPTEAGPSAAATAEERP